jgi:hypothetical protein
MFEEAYEEERDRLSVMTQGRSVRSTRKGEKEKPMKENLEKVNLLARDLRNGKEFPRSPRETLGGYVLTARSIRCG